MRDYFIGVHARELERLREQHAAWQPETHALWKAAGFAPGQRIADLGCGPGFTSLELAGIVGAAGRVIALDKASPYLDYLKAEAKRSAVENVSCVAADVTKPNAIPGPLDGAFCRFFLAFLIADLSRVLDTVARSLKPGGVLAAMEYLTLESATCSPPSAGFDAHTRGWVDYYRKNGGDTAVGAYLPEKLRAAGFSINHMSCAGGMARPSERWWTWWGRLMEDFGDTLEAQGFMTAAELQALRNDWAARSASRDAFIYTPVLLQIVARKR
ncbi:MAG TPA: methyltransferase domain-containing protein [Burkholderiales bacterium]|nr:methyltransferase domain-containing protein [Burkholderiales bacterium]